jgi:hypothetical protein
MVNSRARQRYTEVALLIDRYSHSPQSLGYFQIHFTLRERACVRNDKRRKILADYKKVFFEKVQALFSYNVIGSSQLQSKDRREHHLLPNTLLVYLYNRATYLLIHSLIHISIKSF